VLIRAVWRFQALFGHEGWVPRRERAVLSDRARGEGRDTVGPDHLPAFLEELRLLSARHGLWIENTPRGTRLVSMETGIGGYRARLWPGRDGQFEFDVCRPGSAPGGGSARNSAARDDLGQTGRARDLPDEGPAPDAASSAARKTDFQFDLIYSIETAGVDPDTITDALVEAGCGDAIVGLGRPGLLGLGFTRSGTDPEEVIAATARKVSNACPAHLRLREVRPDLVSLGEVAARLGVPEVLLNEAQRPPPSLGGLYHLADFAVAWRKETGRLAPALAAAAPWFAAAPGAQRINVRLLAARPRPEVEIRPGPSEHTADRDAR
jgi:hypothetical protein